jgi:CheY-like chemotaxis protein
MGPQAHDTILVVEDEADIRETLALVLEAEGFEVATASDGTEALHYLRECPPPCLILLDLMMPGMNGWEFRRQQRQDAALAKIPVLIVSAVADQPGAAPALDAADFLKKPLDIPTLLAKVDRHCQRIEVSSGP